MGAVKKYCNKAVLILKMVCEAIGDFDVSDQYSFDNLNRIHIMGMKMRALLQRKLGFIS